MKNPSVNTGIFSATLGVFFLSEKSSATWSETFFTFFHAEKSSSSERKIFRHIARPVTFPSWVIGFIIWPCKSVNTRIKFLQEEISFSLKYTGYFSDGTGRMASSCYFCSICLLLFKLTTSRHSSLSLFQQKSTSSAFLPIERNNIVVAAAPGERSAVAPGERSAIAPVARTTAPRTTPVFSLQNTRKNS
jgi:hypothetical protein